MDTIDAVFKSYRARRRRPGPNPALGQGDCAVGHRADPGPGNRQPSSWPAAWKQWPAIRGGCWRPSCQAAAEPVSWCLASPLKRMCRTSGNRESPSRRRPWRPWPPDRRTRPPGQPRRGPTVLRHLIDGRHRSGRGLRLRGRRRQENVARRPCPMEYIAGSFEPWSDAPVAPPSGCLAPSICGKGRGIWSQSKMVVGCVD